MSKYILDVHKIAKIFTDYCNSKGYQVKPSKESNNLRIDMSNLSERTIVNIYHTGTVLVQGKQNLLREEMENLKKEFETNPKSFFGAEAREIKSCATRYDIMITDLRTKIKESLSALEARVEITKNPKPAIEYSAKIIRNSSSLTLTQFNNGTLLLQGKTDNLFDNSCDLIEKIANPSDKEVVARFISCDKENLELFAVRYTPQLIELAESNVKNKIGNVYEYLEPYDRKWFVASECLCLSKIPLPEFSPLVMPASKAFEGFVKKLLVGIGLFDINYFKTKNENFSALCDTNHPKRKLICNKDKHADTMLRKVDSCVKIYRHFMMHSDESKITKVDSQKEAEEKVNRIFADTKEIFNYFNDLYSLLPK